jgi:Outer membrane protein beta-barrel domain
MKNTLRLLLVVIIIMPRIDSYAQTFGIKGGLNLSNTLEKDNAQTYNDKMIPGIHLGATVAIPLSGESVFLEPGILFNMKGSKYQETNYSEKYVLYYLDIPVNLKVVFGSNKIKGFGTLGPYIGVGLSGKDTWTLSGVKSSESIKWGNDANNDFLKRLDYGVGIGAGVIVSNVSLGIGYDLGLANIASDASGGYKISNRVLQISIGYLFGKK